MRLLCSFVPVTLIASLLVFSNHYNLCVLFYESISKPSPGADLHFPSAHVPQSQPMLRHKDAEANTDNGAWNVRSHFFSEGSSFPYVGCKIRKLRSPSILLQGTKDQPGQFLIAADNFLILPLILAA